MEAELAKYGSSATGMLIAYVVIKELFAIIRELVGRKGGNGDAAVAHGVKAILGWLTTKGCTIHDACNSGAAALRELVSISREGQLQQQEITREERKWRADVLNAFMRDMK
jgi:hypothetical protein